MTSVSGTSNSTNNGSSSAPTSSGITPDLNLFLKMLTTQLQNQDPLSPMDTTQYTQQLVQYSQVEQEMQQTTTLKSILSGMNSQSLTQASSFIGRQVRFDSTTAGYQAGSPASWTYSLAQTPAKLTATITDSNGKVVNTLALDPAASGSFKWDGTTSSGGKAADGAYTLSLSATTSSGADITPTINSTGVVKDVLSSNGTVVLGVNGIAMPMSALLAISDAAVN